MPFVKLDCGILDSTLWPGRPDLEIFLTALLMAEPHELHESTPQLRIRTLDPTGWSVPAGWYGFTRTPGSGIVRRALVDAEEGLAALERLGDPEPDSRNTDFDGRRLVRVNGGFIVLNFVRFRERDYSSADRSARYRASKKRKTRAERRSRNSEETRRVVDRVRELHPQHRQEQRGNAVDEPGDTEPGNNPSRVTP